MHYIFEVRAKPGYTIEQYAQGWMEVSEYIQQAPGAMGTRLHRKVDDPEVALAIATWDSKSARDAMESDPPRQIADLIAAQKPFIEIRFIGEFEFPDWVVLPPGQALDATSRLLPNSKQN